MVIKAGVAGLVSGLLALACSAISLGIPYWQDLDSGVITGNHGLFRYTIRTSGVEDSGDFLNYLTGSKKDSLRAIRGLCICGTSLIVFAILIILQFLCCSQRRCSGILAAIASFLSTCTHVVAVAVFHIKLEGGGDSTYHASFYLSCVAAFLSAVNGGLLLKAGQTAEQLRKGDNREKPKRDFSLVIAGVVLAVVAIICSAVALGIPYWQDVDTGTVSGHHGLFRYSLTVSGTKTTGNFLNYLKGSDRNYLNAVRWLVIAGTSCLLLAIITIFVLICTKKRWRFGFIGAFCSFVSVAVHIAAVILFRIKLKEGGDSSFHAGFYLVIAAAVVSLVAGIPVVIGTVRIKAKVQESKAARRDRKKEKTYGPIVAAAAVFGVLAIICSAVALGIPYWQDLDTGTVTGHHGLFRYSITVSNTKTTGNYLNYLSGSDRNYLRAVRGLVITGACCLFLAIAAIILFMCSKKNKWMTGFFGAVCCFLSVVVHVTAVILFRVKLKEGGDSSYHAGFYLAIAAAVTSFISGILVVFAALRSRAKVRDKPENDRNDRGGKDKQKKCGPIVIAGVICGVVAIICSAVAVGIPHWQDLDVDTVSGHHGLFRYSLTVAGTKSSGNFFNYLTGSDRNYLTAVKALVLTGTSCLLLAIAAMLIFICTTNRWLIGLCGGILCFLSVVVHVVAVILFSVKFKEGGSSSYHAGFYLAIAAAVVSLVFGIIMTVAAVKRRAKIQDKSGNGRPDRGGKENKKKYGPIVIAGVICGVVAIICSAVAVGIPYWQDLDVDTVSGHHGLFRYSFNVAGTKSSGNFFNYLKGSDRNYLTAVKALVLTGTSCLLLAIAAILIFMCTTNRWLIGLCGGICCFVSVVVHVVAVILFSVKFKEDGSSTYHAGFYLAIAAAVVSLVFGILLTVAAVRTRAKVQDKSDNAPGERNRDGSKGKRTYSVIVIAAAVFGVLAVICSAVALGIPYWQDLDTGTVSGHHGLFRYSITVSGTTFSGNYLNNLVGSERNYLRAVRGLVITGASCLLLAIAAILIFLCTTNRLLIGIFGAICCFISVAVHVVALILFGVKLKGDGDSSYHAGFYLAIVALVFSFVCGILVVIAIVRTRSKVHDKSESNRPGQRAPKRVLCTTLYSKIAIGFLVVAFVAFVIAAIAIGIPYWQHLDTGTVSGDHGLFRYTIKTSGVESSGNYKNLLSDSDKRYLYGVLALVIFGSACFLIAGIIVLVLICSKTVRPLLGIIGSIVVFVSVSCFFCVLVIFGVKLKESGDSSLHAGFYLIIVAAVLGLIAGIILLVISVKECMKGSDKKDKNANDKKPVPKVTKQKPKPAPATKPAEENTAKREPIPRDSPERQIQRKPSPVKERVAEVKAVREPVPRESPIRQNPRKSSPVRERTPEPKVAREPVPRESPIRRKPRKASPVRERTPEVYTVREPARYKPQPKPEIAKENVTETAAVQETVAPTNAVDERTQDNVKKPKEPIRPMPSYNTTYISKPRAEIFEWMEPTTKAPPPYRETYDVASIQGRRKVWQRALDIGLWKY